MCPKIFGTAQLLVDSAFVTVTQCKPPPQGAVWMQLLNPIITRYEVNSPFYSVKA